MNRQQPHSSPVRYFLLLTLLGSLSALFYEVAAQSDYLITSHAPADAPSSALALK